MSIACQRCGNAQATVHLTDLSDGEKSERHLCADCAETEGVVMKAQQPTLNEILNKFVMQQAGVKELADLRCDQCGMTFVEFRSNGQLGCPNDYDAFERALLPLIERSHEGATQHSGKVPERVAGEVRAKIDLVRMRRELRDAIDREQYESAARLRDEIERLEAL